MRDDTDENQIKPNEKWITVWKKYGCATKVQ